MSFSNSTIKIKSIVNFLLKIIMLNFISAVTSKFSFSWIYSKEGHQPQYSDLKFLAQLPR